MSKSRKLRRKMRRPFEALLVYSIFYFIKIFTFRGMRRLGALMGMIVYLLPSQRKLALANLELAYPDKSLDERKKIAKISIIGMATVYLEFIWFYKNPKRIKKYTIVPEGVKESYHANKDPEVPIIFLAMHWGNWEISSTGLTLLDDIPGNVIARRLKNPFLEKMMTEGREFCGLKIIHEKGAARGIVKALKKRTTVGMLVDQNTKTHQGGVFGKFFGLPVTISKMPASLARRMDTKVIIINCKRTKAGFEMCYKQLPKDIKAYEDDTELTQAMLSMMEEFVREDPEQWVWLYKRWNYIPKNWADRKDEFPYYAEMDNSLDYNG